MASMLPNIIDSFKSLYYYFHVPWQCWPFPPLHLSVSLSLPPSWLSMLSWWLLPTAPWLSSESSSSVCLFNPQTAKPMFSLHDPTTPPAHLLQPSVSSVQLLSHVQLFATPWIAARQALGLENYHGFNQRCI